MIMGLRGHNAKHYCNYCNIRGHSNGKHTYCPLQSPKDHSEASATYDTGRNYLAHKLPVRLHQEDHENALYLQNHPDLEFSRSTGIKEYSVFWKLPSLQWPWYISVLLFLKAPGVITGL